MSPQIELSSVVAWTSNLVPLLAGAGLECEVTGSPEGRSPASIEIRIESSERIGGLTIWDSGAAHAEAFAIADGSTIMLEHLEMKDEREALAAILRFVGCIAGPGLS